MSSCLAPKVKNEWGMEVTSSRRRGACDSWGRSNNSGCRLCDEKQESANRAQVSAIWSTAFFLSTLDPAHCVQDTPATCVQVPFTGWGWGIGSCFCWPKINFGNWPKLASIYSPSFPLDTSAQGTKLVTSDIFCLGNCCLGGETEPGAAYSTIFPQSFPNMYIFIIPQGLSHSAIMRIKQVISILQVSQCPT